MDQDENRADPAEEGIGAQGNDQLGMLEVMQVVGQDDDAQLEIHDEELQMEDEEIPDEFLNVDYEDVEFDLDSDDEQDDIFHYEASSSNESISDESMSSARTRSEASVEILVPSKELYSFKPLQLKKCNYKNKSGTPYPLSRSGHRIVATESNLYSLGGYNPAHLPVPSNRNCKLYQELWKYNFATNTWKLILDVKSDENVPKEMASNALTIHNNVLISHGGTGYPFGEICVNDCYVYTTGEKPIVCRLKVTGDMPAAQYGPSIVIHDNHLYTIGGTTGFEYSCDVYRLNLSTAVWECVYLSRPQEYGDPEGRYRHEVAYDGAHIYVLGGGTANSVHGMKIIPAFNLKTHRWDYFDTLPDRQVSSRGDDGFPLARKCFSCVQYTKENGDVEVFITGGLQGDYQLYFSDIWKLNLRAMQWNKIQTATLPKPLFFHSGAHAGNGCMYIFGGIEYKQTEMRRRNDLYKMWMTIPKLSEMCWDAITHYKDDLAHYDHDSLLKMGIPERFVSRVTFVRTRGPLPDRRAGFAMFSSPKMVRVKPEVRTP